MPRSRAGQTSFTSGELDQSLWGRIDVSRYYSGAGLLRNVLVIPQGGLRRRPGMRHLRRLDFGTNGVRLIPFAFNTEQTYCIALIPGGWYVFRGDGVFLGYYDSAAWTATQAAQMNFAQSADTLLLFHPDLIPQRIRRGTTETSWTRDELPLSNIPSWNYGSGLEPVISNTRGWPECGTFHQGRLWLGGFRSRPASLIASVVGDFFNLDNTSALDDRAIGNTIDSDQVNAIHQLRSARSLQVFTSGANYAPDVSPPYTPRNFSLIEQTRRGIKRFSPMAEVDGATLFVQRGGRALRSFLYSDTEAAFRADLLSLLAPHLIRNPTELAMRRGSREDDADHMLLVNADGQPSVLTTLRSQEITAFSRWETDGAVRSVAALDDGGMFFAVLRNGAIQVEMWDDAHLLDSSRRQVAADPFTTLSGLGHLEGRTVQLVGDGAFLGTATVAGGSVTLPRPAREAEAGLPFTLRVETVPLEPRDETGNLLGRVSRIARITARVRDAGTFTLQGRPVVFRQLGANAPVLDTPPPRFTGDVTVRGIAGWRERHVLTIEQTTPGPFTLLALSYDLGIGA